MRQAKRACTDGRYQTNRNLTVDAAASAAPKVASRYLIQDDSAGAGAGAAAARSSSLTSFGSTVATPAVKAGVPSAAATGVEVPAFAGAGGQAATAGAGLSVRSASAAGGCITGAGAAAAESTGCSCTSGFATLAREGARDASRSVFGRVFSS